MELSKQLDQSEHQVGQLIGLRDIPYQIPDWMIDARQLNRGRSVIGCSLLSDIHMGQVMSAEEIQGLNAFNPEICVERLECDFQAVCLWPAT